MKIKNFAMLAGAAAILAACHHHTTISEPTDLNDQRVFFAFNSSEISDEARANLLGQSLYMKTTKVQKSKLLVIATNAVPQNTTWLWVHVVQMLQRKYWLKMV